MNVLTHSYPKDYISETLRKSAWSSDPLGLYPHEGIHSNWESITSSVSSQFGEEQRAELVEIILSQMGEAVSASQRENLESLKKDNTFLAVTGQQIHLGLGPMYVIYKIASAIVLCNDLKRKFTDKNFVPLFWMATEDHDVAEIKAGGGEDVFQVGQGLARLRGDVGRGRQGHRDRPRSGRL